MPTQPRRERDELREETVFHVTNNGDSVRSEDGLETWFPLPIGENEELDDAGVVSVVLGSRELELEDEGVEDPLAEGAERCCSEGFLRARGDVFFSSEAEPSVSWSSSPSSSASESSNTLAYSAHEAWT